VLVDDPDAPFAIVTDPGVGPAPENPNADSAALNWTPEGPYRRRLGKPEVLLPVIVTTLDPVGAPPTKSYIVNVLPATLGPAKEITSARAGAESSANVATDVVASVKIGVNNGPVSKARSAITDVAEAR
jgi:hypothetical protein